MNADDVELVNPLPGGVDDVSALVLAGHEIAHGHMAAVLGHEVVAARLQCSWWSGQVTNGWMRWRPSNEEGGDTWADDDTMVCLAGAEGAALVAAHFTGWPVDAAREYGLRTADHDMQTVKWLKRHTTRSRRDLEREMRRAIDRHWQSGQMLDLSVRLVDKQKVAGKAIEKAA